MISLAPKRATSSKITARSRPDPNSASISPRILSVGDTRTGTGVVLPVQTLVGLVRNLRPSSFTPADGHDHQACQDDHSGPPVEGQVGVHLGNQVGRMGRPRDGDFLLLEYFRGYCQLG